jgi:hypothetical protein
VDGGDRDSFIILYYHGARSNTNKHQMV